MSKLSLRATRGMLGALSAVTMIAAAVPAAALPASTASHLPAMTAAPLSGALAGAQDTFEYGRERYRHDRGYHGNRPHYRARDSRVYYGEPVHRNTRVWRGNDGRYYCRKQNGTTGLIIGGAVGALLGREIDGGYDRTLGTILGAAGGALLGREIDRGGSRCR